MLLGVRVASRAPELLIIILIASIFGGLAFLYSFFGFVGNESTTRFDTFGSLTLQEIGGHFLFGYIVALPTRNLKIGVLAGLMALTIDADHVLNADGFDIQGRMSHSISFAILASVLIGIMAGQIFRKIPLRNSMTTPHIGAALNSKTQENVLASAHNTQDSLLTTEKKNIFFQFLIIVFAAYMSHISYDVFVDQGANFPLFAPFNFNNVSIAQIYAMPIEGAAILLVYLGYNAIARRIKSVN